jgi:hypothetical protein
VRETRLTFFDLTYSMKAKGFNQARPKIERAATGFGLWLGVDDLSVDDDRLDDLNRA